MNKYYDLPFTDVVIEYIKGDNNALDELYRRLLYCDIDKLTAANIIESEIEIIKRKKVKNNFSIKNKFWWINKNDINDTSYSRELLPLQEKKYYLFYNDKISDNALLLSEIISIFDEANYISKSKIYFNNNDVQNEIELISSYNDERSWLLGEIYNRFNYLFHCANKDVSLDIPYSREIIKKFIENETKIIFNIKWCFLFNFYRYTDIYK